VSSQRLSSATSDRILNDVSLSSRSFSRASYDVPPTSIIAFAHLRYPTTMTPHLRILAGPDTHSLQPITTLVNTGKAHAVKSDAFEGEVAVYIKGFPGEEGGEAYFDAPERKGVTWSIQARGP
jgi:hypothetical protein